MRAERRGGVSGRCPRRRLRCHVSKSGRRQCAKDRAAGPVRPRVLREYREPAAAPRLLVEAAPSSPSDYSFVVLQEGGRIPLLAFGESVSCPRQVPPRSAGLCRPPRRFLAGRSV